MSQYENHHLEDSPLPFIFKSRSVYPTHPSFGSSNWHENIEIIHIIKGDGAVSVNGQLLSVGVGDTVAVNSNLLHALAAGESQMDYRYLIVDRSFCLANGFDSNKIAYQAKIRDDRIGSLLEQLHATYEMADDAPYKTLTIRSIVLQLLQLLCHHYSHPAEQADRCDGGAAYIKKAIDYIRAACDKDVSLEDVASFVGISTCYLSREFHRYTGYPFVAYVNRTRCQRAQRMLTDERLEIHEIGIRCGFENASYFARAFRRYIGMSPTEYRSTIAKTQNSE